MTGTKERKSKENFFEELGLMSLQRCWYRKLCCFMNFERSVSKISF